MTKDVTNDTDEWHAAARACVEENLARLREEWPSIKIELAGFVEALAERTRNSDIPANELNELHLSDLFLAHGCVQGDLDANTEFLRLARPEVERAFQGARLPGLTSEDAVQKTLERLLLPTRSGPAKLADYTGRGPLLHWLRVVIARYRIDLARKKERVATAIPMDRIRPARGAELDPELRYFKEHYSALFEEAFTEALTNLAAEDRNLLRLHVLAGMSLEEIAGVEGVHRTTIGRRMARLKLNIVETIRRAFAERLGVAPDEFRALASLVESTLDINMAAALRSEGSELS